MILVDVREITRDKYNDEVIVALIKAVEKLEAMDRNGKVFYISDGKLFEELVETDQKRLIICKKDSIVL